MAVCSACGHDNPGGSKFCAECGAPLGAPARSLREERKVVTSLFCDLVGFTASSEAADPEDVDRMLAAYSAMAQAQIEGHGGVMEKFIGDAVVGVFGAPVAHEDDPERAVRAGLRIVEGAAELEGVGGTPLRLRVGVNTGEALVHLGASAGSGERLLAGDSVNTAARIQSVAPEMGVDRYGREPVAARQLRRDVVFARGADKTSRASHRLMLACVEIESRDIARPGQRAAWSPA